MHRRFFYIYAAGLLSWFIPVGLLAASFSVVDFPPIDAELLRPPDFHLPTPAVNTKQQARVDWFGYTGIEIRAFAQDALYLSQHNTGYSAVLQPTYYREWNDGEQSLSVTPFFRIDRYDDERSHADVRELLWLQVGAGWEMRAGIGKVFWGVTESQHLVDIINQTDLVESLDGEEKLGQPLLDLTLVTDNGTVDIFILPGFRERTFPGSEGRPRTALPVNTDQAEYESSREQRHVDVALRWYQFLGDWEVGLSYFKGTAREPRFTVVGSELIPHYDQLRQAALDAQLTTEGWLWKIEAVSRDKLDDTYTAATGGFEYTFSAVADTDMDLGVIMEYLFDDRGDQATTPFENDLMIGVRLALNDIQSSELLAGFIIDLDNQATLFSVEASRRLGQNWKLNGELRAFTNIPPADLLYSQRQDDYLQIELLRYF